MTYDSEAEKNPEQFEGLGASCSNIKYLDDVTLDQLKVCFTSFFFPHNISNQCFRA